MSEPKKNLATGNRNDQLKEVEFFIFAYRYALPFGLALLAVKLPSDYEFAKFRLLTKLQQTETESVYGSSVCGEFVKKFLPTLPRALKSLLGTPIVIRSDKPRELVELLGNLLGITDYATSMPSFWLLDTLALQALRYKNDLDEYSIGVLISWLTGEIMLLRERKYTREEFFREIKVNFTRAYEMISEKKRLLYWEEIMPDFDTEKETEDQLSSAGDQSMKSLLVPSSQGSVETLNSIDPFRVLDIVIDSTYDMYGNEVRYDLVYAIFVEPIEVETYNSPFTIRTPRIVKHAVAREMPFKTRLQKSLKEIEAMEKSKKTDKKAKGKKILDVPATPAPSLGYEQMLAYNRQFILPLVEANEASDLLEKLQNN